nr:uncharacterized protein LOC123758775 isoform X1 [Procambarus clarkii]XP_045599408.1 uncharacterized protein LOC123758775 isoform X1 [Procambarus clarkii]XP_045599409.1 uncharacterized protein LOC123758775 isoform X1 [Procambarus clarkii]
MKVSRTMIGLLMLLVTVTRSWSLTWPGAPTSGPLSQPIHTNHYIFSVHNFFTNNKSKGGNKSEQNNMYEASKNIVNVRVENAIVIRHDSVNSQNDSMEWSTVEGGLGASRPQRPQRPHNTRSLPNTRTYLEMEKRWPSSASSKTWRNNLYENRKNINNGPSGSPPKLPTNTRRQQINHTNTRGEWEEGRQYRALDPRRPKVRRQLLRQHNHFRSSVTPPAADMLALCCVWCCQGWYERAAAQAQAWAEQCDPHTQTDHPSVRWTSRYGACGQNVLISTTKRRWSEVIAKWWSGRRHFQYGGDHNNWSLVSSYTQMAWYNSHQLGCGFTQCSPNGGTTFFRYVCNYCPTGNDPKRLNRPYSEGEVCSLCPGSCKSLCRRNTCNLCTNACSYSDLWINCERLDYEWHEWLCNTKTKQGVERFKNCRATCQCVNEIT